MRSVASSVTVVTTDGPAGRHGATVSAFCSVSADPPTALICLNAGSRIAGLVAANGIFNVNVLPQGATDIAERFAGAHDGAIIDRFDGIECEGGAAPAIAGATVLSCRTVQEMHSGSHRIFVGHVHALYGGVERPLTYLNGAYHSVVPQHIPCE
ncbi:MAG: flavin reductase family protein [Litoreibacter sp.]|nr:flavin reductase family protein [Litoreibacter sp.]